MEMEVDHMASTLGGGSSVGPAVGAVAQQVSAVPFPVTLQWAAPARSSRWAAVLGILYPAKVLAALPVAALTAVLTVAQLFAAWYGFWAGLCTGRYPAGLQRLLADVLRLQAQVTAWVWSYTDAYPAFGTGAEPAGLHVEVAARPEGRGNRWWALLGVLAPLRMLAAVPHTIVVAVLGLVAAVLGWISFWIILFTGRYPEGLWRFGSGVLLWWLRLRAFNLGLTDAYPPFRLA
jgi:hypothetical protein